MLQQTATVAQAAAVSMFNGLTEGIPGLTAGATQVTVTITVGATALMRNVEVAYSSSVNTIFAQVLGESALPVPGVSEASAQAPPNIDFYVLLDNSPSMALPATLAGITQMQSLTAQGRDRRLRLRLPPGQHQQRRYRRQPLRRRARRRPSIRARTRPRQRERHLLHDGQHGGQIDNYTARAQQQHHPSARRAEQRQFRPCSRPRRRPRSRLYSRPRRIIGSRSIRWIRCGRSASPSSWR